MTCDCELRFAHLNPFCLKLARWMCIFRLSAIATSHVFSHNARYENHNALSFGVSYNYVAQKLRILAIKAIPDPKNIFLTNSIGDRIKIKAEITSFDMRFYMNLIRLRLRVASIKNASCAQLRVRRDFGLRVRQLKIGRKSCFD